MKAAMRAVKNSVMAFDEIEVKVREATSSDRWGVTDTQMGEIARATYDSMEYAKLFQMLWKRLTDVTNVMHVQKALILTEYLLRYGSPRFIEDARRRSRDIVALTKYKHYDEHNNDDAKEARAKAKVVNELLVDEKRLIEERAKASKLKENMRGIGSNDYNNGGGEDRYSNGGGGGGGGEDRYNQGGYGNGSASAAQAEYDNPYDQAPRQQQQSRQQQSQPTATFRAAPVEEDPYADAPKSKAAPAVAALTEEEEAAERKRKKKEKKRQEAAAAAAAAAASSASPAGSNGEDDEDDPFSSSVIPTTVAPPATEGEPVKKKKSKKVKEDKAGASSPPPPVTVAASATPSASSQYAAMASQPQQRQPQQQQQQQQQQQPQQWSNGGDVDLSSFVETAPRSTRNGQGGGDFDFLSGNQNGGNGNLNDMFQNSSISSQPTLWDQPASSAADEEIDFSRATPSSQQRHQQQQQQQQQQQSQQSNNGSKADIWASDLFNLERLDQAPAPPKKSGVVEGGVSMSMMKGLNPNFAPSPANNRNGGGGGSFGFPPQQQQQQPQMQQPQQMMQPQMQMGGGGGGGNFNPAFAHTGGFAAPGPGFGQAPPQLGPQMHYGQQQMMYGGGGQQMGGGYGMMMPPPQQQQYGGGYGMHPAQMQMQMQPQFNQQQQQQQQRFPGNQPNAMASIDPFASLGARKSNGPVDFVVPAARK